MRKAIISAIITIIVGFYGGDYGASAMNYPELGPILAIAVMGFAIITSLEKKQ